MTTAAVPADAAPWILAYEGFDPAQEALREALCALGNGLFVTRGAAEESRADGLHYPGTYTAGGYNQLASEVAGRTVINEDLVNLPNWLPLTFRPADGEWLRPDGVEILAWQQHLHLRDGVLHRRFRVRDSEGRITAVEARRLVSMSAPHLAAIDYRITPENWGGALQIRSALDGAVTNSGVARYRQLASRHLRPLATAAVAPEGVYLLVESTQSRIQIAQAARTRVQLDGAPLAAERRILTEAEDRIGEELRVDIAVGDTVRVEKVVALYTSRDRGIGEPGAEARLAIGLAPAFDQLLQQHQLAWQALWRRYDIELGTCEAGSAAAREQLIVRLHVFHLLQTISQHTVGRDVGAPARGLHGEAYRGHIFWDELFILPFYDYRAPAITRSLLLYRYYRLDAARELARAAGYAGAMFPWQSSSDGREATQEVHLNPLSGRWDPDHSRLQRHVNGAIVYNVWRYYQATGDRAFLLEHGAEMVLEIARFWSSIAAWDEERGRYGIHGVMGPDEYHEKYPGAETGGLRNNAYTNVLAVWSLLRALDVLDEIGQSRRAELMALLGIDPDELDRWEEIARLMLIPFHDDGIISQFEGYDQLEELDWEAYRSSYGNIERLDRILKAEGSTPDRYKVSKQADVSMLFFLFSGAELRALFDRLGYRLTDELLRRNITYYTRRTSHGSTLSRMVFASVIHELDHEEGCRLFLEVLRSDVDDIQQGTTAEGIHLGAMAGTVAIVLHRYAGVSLRANGVHLAPALPDRIAHLRFRIHWHSRWLDIDLTGSRIRITADRDRAEPVPVAIGSEWYQIEPGAPLEVALPPDRGLVSPP
ncbi:MAG TPA: glycosyl hydrolase family 65 protein [Longimicrobiales bacterium]